jgi:hypothetical protein
MKTEVTFLWLLKHVCRYLVNISLYLLSNP